MSDNKQEEALLQSKINIILGQTDYSTEKAKEKLIQFNNDHIMVIKDFFGIAEKKALPIKSVNQEIYKQLRYKLDASMREYNQRKEAQAQTEEANEEK